MKDSVLQAANTMAGCNSLSMKGEIVIFGSTYMAAFPFYELVNKSRLENAVYNRSIDGMTLPEAEQVLDRCVLDLRPARIFLSLGEEDRDSPDAFCIYNRIVSRIREALPASRLYLICLPEKDGWSVRFNESIAGLADGKRITAIRLSCADKPTAARYASCFREMSCFFRTGRITFSEAFAAAAL